MTEQETRNRCEALAAEDPERKTHSWVPREDDDGEWSIVKIAIPPPGSQPIVTSTAEEEQAIKADPRTPLIRNIPPYGG